MIQKRHITERTPHVYIDMEDTIADITGSARRMGIPVAEFRKRPDFVSRLMPVDGAVEACGELSAECHLHILIAPPEENPLFKEEFCWICRNCGELFKKVVVEKKGYHEEYYIHADPAFIRNPGMRRAIRFGSDGYRTWEEVIESMKPFVKLYL